jgi:hypothetical protein
MILILISQAKLTRKILEYYIMRSLYSKHQPVNNNSGFSGLQAGAGFEENRERII